MAATQIGMPPVSTFIESSHAKSTNKVKSKSSEGGGVQTVTLLAEGSAYSDPSFIKDVTEGILLSADCKRLNVIGPAWRMLTR